MAKDTPSIAKNKIKRSLSAILDPHPTAKEVFLLWEYFGHACAYCGLLLDRKSRLGHLDHVVSQAEGGNNSIYNHVLSCAKCNGDEKKEQDWLKFLSQKSEDAETQVTRKLKIERWIVRNKSVKTDPLVAESANKIISDALAQFDESVSAMRKLRQ